MAQNAPTMTDATGLVRHCSFPAFCRNSTVAASAALDSRPGEALQRACLLPEQERSCVCRP